jgi:polycomb protein EED
LLCIAGSSPKQIKILDFLRDDTDETIVRTLPGHGKGINDLAVHPHSTNLIASASEDYTIRLWDLRPKFENQPCVAMFCGEGHKQPTLAMSFHPNGRWLLSGGLDTAVCLWAVPGLDELDRPAEELKEHHKPKEVYYPHFFSTEVHHNYVDCLQFYGDLILSRAAKDQNSRSSDNEIILWRIEGFDPDDPPPVRPPIPVPDVYTRSSFSHSPETRGFQRLLSFSIPHTDRFYHRFGLLVGQGMRPILSMGNQQSTFLFWDLQRLQEGWDPAEEKKKKGGGTRGRKPKSGVSSENLNRLNDLRSGSVASDGTGGTTRKFQMQSIPSHGTSRSY